MHDLFCRHTALPPHTSEQFYDCKAHRAATTYLGTVLRLQGTPRCHHIPRNSSTIARHTALPPHTSEQFYDCKAHRAATTYLGTVLRLQGTPRCHHMPRNSSTIARHTALPPHASEQFYDCKAPAVVAVCDSDDTATWPTDMFSTKCAACCLRRAVGCDPAHALRLQDTAGQNDAWYGSHLPAPCAYRACQTRFGWPFSASSGAATSGLGRAGHVVVTYFYFSFGVLSC